MSEGTINRIESKKKKTETTLEKLASICTPLGLTIHEISKHLTEKVESPPTVQECIVQLDYWLKRLTKAQGMK